ncbi:type IV pilin protein [Moraxella bovis]|uniref:type IV pilin protein n=1 Tax=Moraxella bovis TaxID=476 RepID=UPI0023EED0F5|nr:type IV pilin protein [Moraxella bovis]
MVIENKSKGFTLVELMLAVAVIGILAAIAYPSYQNYIIKTKRANMMADMQNMAGQIESKKMMLGGYANIPTAPIISSASPESSELYNVVIAPLTDQWVITATPNASGQMKNDGNLQLHADGRKCRAGRCGTGDEWR